MAYKTCENCGCRIYEYGCVNCNEEDYITMLGYYDEPHYERERTGTKKKEEKDSEPKKPNS